MKVMISYDWRTNEQKNSCGIIAFGNCSFKASRDFDPIYCRYCVLLNGQSSLFHLHCENRDNGDIYWRNWFRSPLGTIFTLCVLDDYTISRFRFNYLLYLAAAIKHLSFLFQLNINHVYPLPAERGITSVVLSSKTLKIMVSTEIGVFALDRPDYIMWGPLWVCME